MFRIALAVAIILSGSLAVAQEETKKDLKRFQGSWKIVSLMQGGKEVAQGKEDNNVVISGNEFTLTLGKEKLPKTVFKIDATKKPATIDLGLAEEKGFPNKGIYEWKGDMLTLCWGGDGAPRPTKLTSTKKGDERLLVLRRIKK